jgi:hypothetical protein
MESLWRLGIMRRDDNSTLFDTGQYFTLSGDQPCKIKHFQKPEPKAPLEYFVTMGQDRRTVRLTTQVTVDELYEGKAILKGGVK